MMEGLKEALQYITGLKEKSMEPKLVEIEGRTYCTDNGLTRYHRFPMASDIEVNTLTVRSPATWMESYHKRHSLVYCLSWIMCRMRWKKSRANRKKLRQILL